MDDDAASFRQSLKLSGEIDLGWKGVVARLARVEVERRGADLRLKLEGLLAELRKLAIVSPAYAALLDRVANDDGARRATLTLVATPALSAQMATIEAGLGLADEWLDNATWAGLLFSLDRHEPESVGIVTAEWSG
jgi:hypothetical protein